VRIVALYLSILVYGVILSAANGLIIMAALYFNPRLLMRSYPKEIKQAVQPQTAKEKKQAIYLGILFLAVLIGLTLVSTLAFKHVQGGEISFRTAFAHLFGVSMVFNAADWLIIDWLIFCTILPKFLVIPGTEGHPGYKNYFFHFKGFLTGTVLLGLLSVLLAWIVIAV
jgi:hypothetical protein